MIGRPRRIGSRVKWRLLLLLEENVITYSDCSTHLIAQLCVDLRRLLMLLAVAAAAALILMGSLSFYCLFLTAVAAILIVTTGHN